MPEGSLGNPTGKGALHTPTVERLQQTHQVNKSCERDYFRDFCQKSNLISHQIMCIVSVLGQYTLNQIPNLYDGDSLTQRRWYVLHISGLNYNSAPPFLGVGGHESFILTQGHYLVSSCISLVLNLFSLF